MTTEREELLKQLWEAQNEAYELMSEYDAIPHCYGQSILYQAEGRMVDLIAIYPDITITELGELLKKTPSACSQIVRKLKKRGLVEQIRNPENNRKFNLRLTDSGRKLYQDHLKFNQDCQEITFKLLESFNEADIARHVAVQRMLNQAYRGDVQRSRDAIKRIEKVLGEAGIPLE